MTTPELVLKPLEADLVPPRRSRPGDAAIDLPARHDGVVEAGRWSLVPTGFAVAVPDGYCGLVLPRSGLALKHGITVLNAPGLIDSGYRGELQVILFNAGPVDFTIEKGQRIAQLLLVAVPQMALVVAEQLPPAPDDRGEQGFGSSGC